MRSWETRRPGEMTTEYLGRVLEDYLNLPELAARARLGHFDDYFAPEEVASGFELIVLVKELTTIATRRRDMNRPWRLRIREVVQAVKEGEFDGTPEESARWEASKGGQEAMADPRVRAAAEVVLKRAQEPGAIDRANETVERITGRIPED